MTITYKKLLVIQAFNDAVVKSNFSADEYAVIGRLAKLVKKLTPQIEEFQEMVEDLRLDYCMKDGLKILRENGQLQWTAEGEKGFRKAYKELLNTTLELDGITPLSYNEILALLPPSSGDWEDVKENLSPFFEYHT